jgi:hypothetical protein
MTHEYVIAYNGIVEPRRHEAATAVGWAAEALLAVGSDATVRSISRGDSTFIDLDGCVVTALPSDVGLADALVRATTDPGLDIGRLLTNEGLIDPGATLEPGSPADLAFWGLAPDPGSPDGRIVLHLLATVREGHFTEGDQHRGPFPAPSS